MKLMTALQLLYRLIAKGDEYARFVLATNICQWLYPRYKCSDFGRFYLYDDDFLKYYESFEGTGQYYTLDRKYTLAQLMKLVTDVAGDTAECGAYKGASSYLICQRLEGSNKKHHVFDSFDGLSRPGPQDGSHWRPGDLAAGEEIIRANLTNFDFVVYHRGWIPEKFPEVAAARFSFLHLDVDLYQPTLDSLNFFYEKMSPGGLILCDDYGFLTCPGAKMAMDAFFADKPEQIVALSTGQGLVIKK
jgi:O-methyltransferase